MNAQNIAQYAEVASNILSQDHFDDLDISAVNSDKPPIIAAPPLEN